MDTIITRLEKRVAGALGRAGYSGADLVERPRLRRDNNTTLVVAVSGGSDSLALLYCLYHLREQHRLQLHVAHLNHDFRGEEAEADARFVAALAQELGLPVTVKKLDPQEYQRQQRVSSFEQAARELRYAFLSGVAEDIGAAAVALGHTADDLAETVLMHLLRGAGLHGLRGMAELSAWPWPAVPSPSMGEGQDGGATPLTPILSHKGRGDHVEGRSLQMFRPLLQATKAETAAYCWELGLVYREDTSNYLRQFTRNRVRHELLPLLAAEYNPRVRESLVRLARTVALELDYLEGEVDQAWPQVATVRPAFRPTLGPEGPEHPQAENVESVSFDRARLAALHPLLQRLILRRGYAALVGDTRRLEEAHLNAMSEMVAAPSGHSLDLPMGLQLHSVYRRLVLCRANNLPCPFPPLEGEHPISLPTSEGQEAVTKVSGWRVTAQIVIPPVELTSKGLTSLAPSPSEPVLSGVEGMERGVGGEAAALTAYFDRGSLGNRLCIRTRRPGDRFQPLGLAQDKKLQDFFTDSRVPRAWRDRVPLLVSNRGIAWVVGYRIAEWAKVVVGDLLGRPAVCVTFILRK